MEIESRSYLITLPLIPSHQGRGNELLDKLWSPSLLKNTRVGRSPAQTVNRVSIPAQIGFGNDPAVYQIQPCSWNRFLSTSAISVAVCLARPSTVLRPLSWP